MAQLALSYARDESIPAGEAVSTLYASALKQKRTYIRQFARVLEALDGTVRHPEAIPRALGLDVYKLLDAEPERAGAIMNALMDMPDRDAAAEMRVLRDSLVPQKKAKAEVVAKSVSKTSLRLGRPEGEARVTASDGKVELRLDRDFSAVPRARLQAGIEAFLATLDEEG